MKMNNKIKKIKSQKLKQQRSAENSALIRLYQTNQFTAEETKNLLANTCITG
jgi:hypothetical protein